MGAIVVQGFFVSLGLIVAIGAQNAFVLRQGLAQHNVFWVVLVCCLCDALLMTAGIFGLGAISAQFPWFAVAMSIFGALFLFWYGALAFKRAYQGGNAIDVSGDSVPSALKSVGMTLAMTLLNPHVYLDTLVLVGSATTTLSMNAKLYFLVGAVSASFVWFFMLGYGARWLLPLFTKPKSWQILDAAIGVIMWLIAFSLLWGLWARA